MAGNDEHGGIFAVMFGLFAFFLIVLLGAFISTKFVELMPANTLAATIPQKILSTIFGLFDGSFLFIAMIALFGDVVAGIVRPSVQKGVLNIFLLFGLVFVFLFFNTFTYTLASVLNANTLMPYTYLFFSNHYTLFLLISISILAIILNFRQKKRTETQEYDTEAESYGS